MAEKQNQDARQITANRLSVRNGTLIAGHITFQIRNIVSIVAQRCNDDFINVSTLALVLVSALACICAAFLVYTSRVDYASLRDGTILFAVLAFAPMYLVASRILRRHELLMITNATTSFRLASKHWRFLYKIKRLLEAAMDADEKQVIYNIDMANQRIDVSNSRGTNINTGTTINSPQSNNVSVVQQGLQDISELD